MAYADILSEIQYLMGNRTDLTAIIPSYVSRAENEIYTSLRVMPMETAYTLTTTSAQQTTDISPLSGFVSLKTLRIPNAAGINQAYQDSEWVYDNYQATVSANGLPQYYGFDANALVWGPIPDNNYTVNGVYFKRLDSLSNANTNNWLTDMWSEMLIYISLWKGFEATRDNAQMLSDYRQLSTAEMQKCLKFYERQQIGGSFMVGTAS